MKKSLALILVLVLAPVICTNLVFAQGGGRAYKVSKSSNPANKKVTVHADGISFSSFLNKITEQTGMTFLMTGNFPTKDVTVHLSNIELKEVLDFVFNEQNLGYQFVEGSNTIVITKKMQKESQSTEQKEVDLSAPVQEDQGYNYSPEPVQNKQSNPSLNKRITVRISDTPLKYLANSLKIHTGNKFNFIPSADVVNKKVSLDAKNITLKQILDYISDEYNLKYKQEGNNIYIEAK
ncbi:MAG: STN domain-containing protein [Elusimicrobiaceae bacterium]|nr:STN domain-containing protein [Elusimicrobiaceae bacterium]